MLSKHGCGAAVSGPGRAGPGAGGAVRGAARAGGAQRRCVRVPAGARAQCVRAGPAGRYVLGASWNHGMGWAGRQLKDHLVPTSLLWAGIHPGLGMEHPQLL